MTIKDKLSENNQASRVPRQATIPAVGEPLDGRHFLDVIEEQQYSGKPFVRTEQDKALGETKEEEKKSRNKAKP